MFRLLFRNFGINDVITTHFQTEIQLDEIFTHNLLFVCKIYSVLNYDWVLFRNFGIYEVTTTHFRTLFKHCFE